VKTALTSRLTRAPGPQHAARQLVHLRDVEAGRLLGCVGVGHLPQVRLRGDLEAAVRREVGQRHEVGLADLDRREALGAETCSQSAAAATPAPDSRAATPTAATAGCAGRGDDGGGRRA
jgi:hypothetical protein